MPRSKDLKRVEFQLPEELKQKLIELANADNRSLANYLLQVVTEHVDDIEKLKRK